jgi:hypothetical protein
VGAEHVKTAKDQGRRSSPICTLSTLSGVARRATEPADYPAFVEIEGPDGASVREAVRILGLDYSQARFGSVDEIYKSELGRDILAEPTLLFANETALR